MNTDSWLKVSGCDESKILADQSYCSALLCGLCSRLVSLDAAIAQCCNQPFCCTCLEKYESACTIKQDQVPCPCSRYHTEDHIPGSSGSGHFNVCCEHMVVKSLKSSQPLAFKILSLTLIECLHNSCKWTGCYSKFDSHLAEHQKKDVESRLQNISISKTNRDVHTKERYESKSPFGHEAKYSEKSTHEEIPKIRKMRAYTIDSTHEPNFDNSFLLEAPQSFVGTNELHSLDQTHDQPNDAETSTANCIDNHEVVARAEKLKKQANAKFNAGIYLDARALYTEGIKLLKGVKPDSIHDLKLLSDMHSNRAATYFRYKKFDDCIKDCEDAIQYDPTLEKSWIRKWRSLMAKGEFHKAHAFLEAAAANFPESNRISDEYNKSSNEMRMMTLLQRSIETGNLIDADTIIHKSFDVSHCENVSLLKRSADVMISTGNTNDALKYIERALEINPKHEDCLELQGSCFFFNGNMKEAVHMLTESSKESSSVTLKNALERFRRCHTLYCKAKIQTHHGKHDEADELLTSLIRECEPLPTKSKLFSMLRVDRAHNSLLMKKHLDVLEDCQEVINVNREFAPIWIIRSEVLFALGKVDEARIELLHIRKTWGAGDSTIESKYRKMDFEFRVSRASIDVDDLQRSLDSGTCDTLPIVSFSDPLCRKTSHSKRNKRSDVEQPIIHPIVRRSSIKHDKRCDDPPVVPATDELHRTSITISTAESLDRWSSHFKREKSSDEKTVMVNRHESLSQSSNHATRRKEKSGDEIPGMVRRTDSYNQSSNHTSRNKSNDSLGTGVPSSRRVLLRKSSLNEKLSHSTYTVDEPKVRRVQHRRASLGAISSDYTRQFETHAKHDSIDEKGKPHRLRRSGSINEKEMSSERGKPQRLRRSGSINEKDPQKTTVNPRKPPERHKSSDNVLCQSSTDKLAEFRQLQRKKTMNGIFGSDWKNDSASNLAVAADLVERPGTRRSKSDDLMDLRKALSDVYSGKAT